MIPQETSMNIRATPLITYIISSMEETVLKINGKRVKLKDFPMRALRGTVLGFVRSLNLEEEPKEIEIIIKVDEEDNGDRRV